jgi:hypothetical protein
MSSKRLDMSSNQTASPSEILQMRRALDKLRALEWTEEEQRILDEFEDFRRQHPIDFSSFTDEDDEAAAGQTAPKPIRRE